MEIFRALGALAEPPSPELAEVADALDLGRLPALEVHTDLFEFQLYPFASIYLGPEGMLGGLARDRIAGFFRAVDADPLAEPDHLTHLLASYASFAEAEKAAAGNARAMAAANHARSAFLDEHLLSWLPVWLSALERLCANAPARRFYQAWGRLLADALDDECRDAGTPTRLALHLREAPVLADPRRQGTDAFLGGILAPAVSGVVLVRDDFTRCAHELDLGLRKGERRFVLLSLLQQAPAAILRWLAAEAYRQGSAYPPNSASGGHWRARAEATALVLGDLAKSTRARGAINVD